MSRPETTCQDCGASFSYHHQTHPVPKRCAACRLAWVKRHGTMKTSQNAMIRHSFVSYPLLTPSEGCQHHWLIESPKDGGPLPGRCRKCGETRDFMSSWDGVF